jgi:hypothetical protein
MFATSLPPCGHSTDMRLQTVFSTDEVSLRSISSFKPEKQSSRFLAHVYHFAPKRRANSIDFGVKIGSICMAHFITT